MICVLRQALAGKQATAHRILWSHEGKASFKATELRTTCIFQASSSSGCQNGTHGCLGSKFQAQKSMGSRRGVQSVEEGRAHARTEWTCSHKDLGHSSGALPLLG